MCGLCEDILGELQIIDSVYCEIENCEYLSTKYDFLNIVRNKLKKMLSTTVNTDNKNSTIIPKSTSMNQLLNNLFDSSSNINDHDSKVDYLRISNKNNIIDLYKIYFIDSLSSEEQNINAFTEFTSVPISKNDEYKNNIKIMSITTNDDPSKKINDEDNDEKFNNKYCNEMTNSEINVLTSNPNEVNQIKTNEENKQKNQKSKYIKKMNKK